MSSLKPGPNSRIRRSPRDGRQTVTRTDHLLRERLLEALLREITDGNLKEGQRFPPRRTLENTWGVSKETLAHATAWLQGQGLIEKTNRKTIVVAAGALAAARKLAASRSKGRLRRPALARKTEGESVLTKGATGPQTLNREGSTFLHAQLVKSLLVELASGTYGEDSPFLTRRKVATLWRVSKSTADRAWMELTRSGLIRQVTLRRWLVCPGAMNRACLLLAEQPQPALPPPKTWQSRRNRILQGDGRPEGYRLLAIHDDGNITHEDLARICFLVAHPVREMPGRHHLAFFQQEIARNFCEADYFYDDGSPSARDLLQEHLASGQYHGVAVFRNNLFHSRQSLFRQVAALQLPVAAVLSHCEGEADVSIDCNDVQGGFTAMRVLLEKKHRRILVLAGDLDRPFLQRRLEGVMDCVRRMDLKGEVSLEVVPTPDAASASRGLARALRRRHPPGALLFLWNKQLQDCDRVFDRLRPLVPRQISVIACGAIIFRTRLFGIPDTVLWDAEEIGRIAARQLLGLVHGDPIQRAIQLEMPYIKHGTVAPWKPRPAP